MSPCQPPEASQRYISHAAVAKSGRDYNCQNIIYLFQLVIARMSQLLSITDLFACSRLCRSRIFISFSSILICVKRALLLRSFFCTTSRARRTFLFFRVSNSDYLVSRVEHGICNVTRLRRFAFFDLSFHKWNWEIFHLFVFCVSVTSFSLRLRSLFHVLTTSDDELNGKNSKCFD